MKTVLLFISLLALCACQTLQKDKDNLKKIAHDVVDEEMDKIPGDKK